MSDNQALIESPQTEIDSLPDNSIYCQKDIPIEKLIDLRSKGLSYQQIAAICNCSKQNVNERLAVLNEEIDNVTDFKKHRADILAITQNRLLKNLDESTIQKMPVRDRIVSFGILFDKERLERGKDIERLAGLADVLGALHKLRKVVDNTQNQGNNEGKTIDVTPQKQDGLQ